MRYVPVASKAYMKRYLPDGFTAHAVAEAPSLAWNRDDVLPSCASASREPAPALMIRTFSGLFFGPVLPIILDITSLKTNVGALAHWPAAALAPTK
jgi:hypothetical protein